MSFSGPSTQKTKCRQSNKKAKHRSSSHAHNIYSHVRRFSDAAAATLLRMILSLILITLSSSSTRRYHHRTCGSAHVRSQTYRYSHTRAHARSLARTRARMHTHVRTHTHTFCTGQAELSYFYIPRNPSLIHHKVHQSTMMMMPFICSCRNTLGLLKFCMRPGLLELF